MSETMQTYRRRRLTALVALGAIVLVGAVTVRACGGDERVLGVDVGAGDDTGSAAAADPVALPGGGRTIFPDYRVVAFYGAPQDEQLVSRV